MLSLAATWRRGLRPQQVPSMEPQEADLAPGSQAEQLENWGLPHVPLSLQLCEEAPGCVCPVLGA